MFYPLSFRPISTYRLWGGNQLKTMYNKPFEGERIGESWELSTVQNNISEIELGAFAGQKLDNLIRKYPHEILGQKVFDKYGYDFPLLFKLIDAADDLSIQVHPNDEVAKAKHNSFGKTEMWYVLQADEGAQIVAGFKSGITKETYLENFKNNTFTDILRTVNVKTGDVFFIETGTIHAIGKGVMIAEIQQTSDLTYRIFDYNRLEKDGKTRELHTDLALDVLNFNENDVQVHYQLKENETVDLVKCPYFYTKIIDLKGEITVEKSEDSFQVYMVLDDAIKIQVDDMVYDFIKGQTILMPACLTKYNISGQTKLLEVCIAE
jgi:mannose-6-phosphate isomerase